MPSLPRPENPYYYAQTANSEIFKNEVLADLNSDFFPEQEGTVDPETLNTLDNFIAALVEKFNYNETPDLKMMAKKFRVPLETAKEH